MVGGHIFVITASNGARLDSMKPAYMSIAPILCDMMFDSDVEQMRLDCPQQFIPICVTYRLQGPRKPADGVE